MKPTFELCAETLDACDAANLGGADRIELCVNLQSDGTTPPEALVAAAVERSRLPVHVLVRPVDDNFVYCAGTFARMRTEVVHAREQGVAGVVTGVLRADRTVDVEAMRELVGLAGPLPVEFHRAFDRTPDLFAALEDVLAAGCERVLTSGGAPTVVQGAPVLARLVEQAGERIAIAAGGGLRLENAAALKTRWRGRHYHGSLGGAHDGVDALAKRVAAMQFAIARGETSQG